MNKQQTKGVGQMKRYGLHYGLDPDTGGEAVYLWNQRRHHVARWWGRHTPIKLFKLRKAVGK